MRMVLRILALVVVVGASIWLVLENDQLAVVDLGFATVEGPLWLAILGSLLLGALAAGLACSWPLLRYRLRLRRSRQRIQELEQELHGLRTLPLGSDAGSRPPAPAQVNEG